MLREHSFKTVSWRFFRRMVPRLSIQIRLMYVDKRCAAPEYAQTSPFTIGSRSETGQISEAFSMLGRRRGPEHSFRDPLKRPHPLTEAAASTAAATLVTLAGSDIVASTHGFAVTCNGKRSPSSCERGSKGEIGSVCELS